MLLVLSHWSFPLDHLHFHGTGHEELPAVLLVSTLFSRDVLSEYGVVLSLRVALTAAVVHLMISDALSRRGNHVAAAGLVATTSTASRSANLC